MRRLIWIVLLLAIGWSAWWFVGAAALRRGIDAGLSEMREAGWQVEIEDRRVRGFPNRFDTTVLDPVVTGFEARVTWSAPFVQVLALSYRPNKAIVAFADTQTVETPFGTARIETARARGSLTLAPGPNLALRHSEFVIDDLVVETGSRIAADELLFATRLSPDDASGRVHKIGLTIRDLTLPDALVPAAEAEGAERIGYAALDATATFPRPIDRAALVAGLPRPDAIVVDRLTLDWGEIDVSGSGALEVDADGHLTGVLELELKNWRAALDLAARIGLVPEAQLPALRQGLGLLTGLSNDPDTLVAPLTFRAGDMSLGPVPLGPAPRLPPS